MFLIPASLARLLIERQKVRAKRQALSRDKRQVRSVIRLMTQMGWKKAVASIQNEHIREITKYLKKAGYFTRESGNHIEISVDDAFNS